MYDHSTSGGIHPAVAGLLLFVGFFILLVAWCGGYPIYRVWSQEKAGQADLAEAEWNRQIAIEEANATMLSAQKLAAADSIRAHGVAAANEIIGNSLKNNWEYLQWLAVENLKASNADLIYVPHTGGLPLLEATRGLRIPAPPPAEE